MILLIDNYDSFSYNLCQLIGGIRPDIQVIRNDERTVEEIRTLAPDHLILSPGPGRPADAGICERAVAALAGERAAERLLDVLGLVLPVALMGLGVVLFARGMGLALGVFGAWLALLQPGMTCQGGKHDVKYSYYHM